MNIEDFRNYCISLPGCTECFPFDDVTLVFKVGPKMFALASFEGDFWVNLKCDPERAIQLREEFTAVQPGYHMSKKHWNTIYMDGSITASTIKEWINNSYNLVFNSLNKTTKEEILKMAM